LDEYTPGWQTPPLQLPVPELGGADRDRSGSTKAGEYQVQGWFPVTHAQRAHVTVLWVHPLHPPGLRMPKALVPCALSMTVSFVAFFFPVSFTALAAEELT
jgi:hypothetical protein